MGRLLTRFVVPNLKEAQLTFYDITKEKQMKESVDFSYTPHSHVRNKLQDELAPFGINYSSNVKDS